jgi:DnaJ-domain-containing protein 1
MDMTEQEQRAVLVLCLQAAFADGSKADAERDEVKRIAEGFPDAAVDLPRLPGLLSSLSA